MTNIRRIGYDEADALVPHRIIGAVICPRIAPREIAVMKEIGAVPDVCTGQTGVSQGASSGPETKEQGE